MNKFLTEFNGRLPFILNDLRFIDTSNREMFSTIMASIVANNKILHGCYFTNNGNGTYSVTAGAVVIDLEVYISEAQTFACTNIAEAYFVINETYDAEGYKRFGDGIERNTYQVRRVACQQSASQPANSISVNVSRFENYFVKEGDSRLTNSRVCNNTFDSIITSRTNLDVFSKSEVSTMLVNAIDALIAGAPGALDTLNELAAALGDDPNFATTIINSLATKVDKVAGYGLSENNFTDLLLTKLNSVAENANNYSPEIGVWQGAILNSGFQNIGGAQPIIYRKILNGTLLQISGVYEKMVANDDYIPFNLPVGFRPAFNVRGKALKYGGYNDFGGCHVYTNGEFIDDAASNSIIGYRYVDITIPLT